MTAPGTDVRPGPDPAEGGRSGLGRAIAGHKPQVLVIGGAAALGGIMYLKNRSSTAAPAAGTTGATGTTVPAGGYPSDPYSAAQDAYNSLEPQLEAMQSQISTIATTSQPAPAPAPTSTPAPGSASASAPGFGIVPTALGNMVLLGTVGGGSGFEAGGGAPVYFGNSQTLKQGAAAVQKGASVYVPVAWASQVSAKPASAAPFL